MFKDKVGHIIKMNKHTIRTVAMNAIISTLIIAFISIDISWAFPDSLPASTAKKSTLAPQSFFADDGAVELAYAAHVENLLEHNIIPASVLTINAICAILEKHKDEPWFTANIGYAVADHEVFISFSSGYVLRYFDPTGLSVEDQNKYSNQVYAKSGRFASSRLNKYLSKQLLRTTTLPVGRKEDVSLPTTSYSIRPTVVPLENFAVTSAYAVAKKIRYYQKELISSGGHVNLALSQGNTMIGFLKELAKAKDIDWSKVNILQTIEYKNMPPDSVFSFRSFMQEHFLDNLPRDNQVPTKNIYGFLNLDPNEYRKRLKGDLHPHIIVLGLGVNGHLGFNEPGSSFNSLTREVELSDDTIRFDMMGNPIFRIHQKNGHRPMAYTMGMAEILSADSLFLLARGRRKYGTVKDALRGPVSTDLPATALQTVSEKVTVVLDKEAALGFLDVARGSPVQAVEQAAVFQKKMLKEGFRVNLIATEKSEFFKEMALRYLGYVMDENELDAVLTDFPDKNKTLRTQHDVDDFERILQNRILDYVLAHHSQEMHKVSPAAEGDRFKMRETFELFRQFSRIYKMPFIRERVSDRNNLLALFILANIRLQNEGIASPYRSRVAMEIMTNEIFLNKDSASSEFAIAVVIETCIVGQYFVTHLYPLLKESEGLPNFAIDLMNVVIDAESDGSDKLPISDKNKFFEMSKKIIKDLIKDDLEHGNHYFTRKLIEYSYAFIATHKHSLPPTALELFRWAEDSFTERMDAELHGSTVPDEKLPAGEVKESAGFEPRNDEKSGEVVSNGSVASGVDIPVYKESDAGVSKTAEDPYNIAALHQCFARGLAEPPLVDESTILLSENLFIGKDGDRQALEEIKAVLARLINNGSIAILPPAEVRRQATVHSRMTKDKMAVVFTKEDFENREIWNGTDKAASIRASVLILKDENEPDGNDRYLGGGNYLYLEGVIGLARAMMAGNKQAIREYYRLMSGVVLDSEIVNLLKDDDQNNVAFALEAILRLKPIRAVTGSEEFNKARFVMESVLIAA